MQQVKSSERINYRYSAENIIRMLGIKVETDEQTEGSILFKFGEYKKMFTTNNETLTGLPKIIKDIQELFKTDKRIHYTKFFNTD